MKNSQGAKCLMDLPSMLQTLVYSIKPELTTESGRVEKDSGDRGGTVQEMSMLRHRYFAGRNWKKVKSFIWRKEG